jgi:hypothetical protein
MSREDAKILVDVWLLDDDSAKDEEALEQERTAKTALLLNRRISFNKIRNYNPSSLEEETTDDKIKRVDAMICASMSVWSRRASMIFST